MPVKKFQKSYKKFRLALALVSMLLLVTIIVTILQILSFGKTGNESARNFENYMSIQNLYINYKNVEEQHLLSLLNRENNKSEDWQQLMQDNEESLHNLAAIYKNNNRQLEGIKNIQNIHEQIINELEQVGQLDTSEESLALRKELQGKISDRISLLNDRIEVMLALESQEIYTKSYNLKNKGDRTVLFFILTSMIAGLILVFSFYKMAVDTRKLIEISGFLENVLNETKDIVNLYEPVYENENLTDFKIVFASKANDQITDNDVATLTGKKVSEVYPFLTTSGHIHELLESFKEQENYDAVEEIEIKGKKRNFWIRYFPSKTDMKVFVTEVTKTVKDAKKLLQLNKKLSLSNEILSEAERIANMGSYIWYMEDDHTILSDNVYRIMGYEPQEFTSSATKFREFTHPEDLELYDKNIAQAITEDKAVEFIFRIITKDGFIKHLYTNGTFREHEGKKTMIGVIQDVSNRIAAENELKEKNITLTRQNIELESFNRIASHDLQEPLRKVQMFLSRLSDKEKDKLSERGQEYLQKVHEASNRMRVLINNLLALSRIGKKEAEFELTNLNTILEDVIDDLALAIEESKATINYGSLPEVYGIPFQLEQLFNNLIGNAIKYQHTDRAPLITIEAATIKANEIATVFRKTANAYYEIKISDNGMGFDNAMRMKIFEMFQRLHQKHEYSGTGIGLAICKKIVEKHQGYITASGKKGVGASFIIYLPIA